MHNSSNLDHEAAKIQIEVSHTTRQEESEEDSQTSLDTVSRQHSTSPSRIATDSRTNGVVTP